MPVKPKTTTLRVKAARADVPCPMMRKRIKLDKNGKDLTLIHADQSVVVPNNRYYRRRILKGDLVLVKPRAPKKVETK